MEAAHHISIEETQFMPTQKILLRRLRLYMVAVSLFMLLPEARTNNQLIAQTPAPAAQKTAKPPKASSSDSPPHNINRKNRLEKKTASEPAPSPPPPSKAPRKSRDHSRSKHPNKTRHTKESQRPATSDHPEGAEASEASESQTLPPPLWQHHPYSLNHITAGQHYGYHGTYTATALRYQKKTFYSFAGNSAFKDDHFGPYLQAQLIHRERSLPLVFGLNFAFEREQGSKRTPSQQGPINRHSDASSLSLTYLYQPGLSLALQYASHSQKTRGGFYRNTYAFAWQEYSLATLYYTRAWELGLQLRPGVLKVSYYQDDNEALALAVPSELTLHAAYRLRATLTVFGKLKLLRQSSLNHGFDSAWANQAKLALGAAYTARIAVFELVLSTASDGFRDINQYSASRIGQNAITANVIKPWSSTTVVGGSVELASDDATLNRDSQDWVLTANQRSLRLFISWQPVIHAK